MKRFLIASARSWTGLLALILAAGHFSQAALVAQVMAIEEVAVIGTRTETPLSELPANISILNAEDLQTIAPVHIQQALSQVPGVSYQRGNGQESLPAIRSAVLTGAGACGNILVLEEAIPVRGAGFCNVNELFDTHYEQAGAIEVVRGANTAFYGSNAMLGSINVRLPIATDDRVSLELGPNRYRRIKATAGYGGADDTQGRLFLTLSDDDGYRQQSGYQQQKFSWRHAGSVGDWQFKLGTTVTHLDQQTAGFVVGLDSYKNPQLRRQNLDPEAFRKTDAVRAWASFSHSLDERRTLMVTPYLRFTEMDFLQHFLPGEPLEQNRQHGFGWQSSLRTVVSEQLHYSLGIDAEVSTGELLQTQDIATAGSAFLRATIPVGTHYDYTVDARQLGLFGHVNWQIDARWQLIAGLRLENLAYQYDNLALDGRTRDDGSECGFGGCRYSRPADRRDRFTHLSPKLELQFKPSAAWRWHLTLADSFRAPQATELYRLQRAQMVADLDEVRARHLEFGAKFQRDQTQVDVSLYKMAQRNVIIRDSDFFNIGGQRIDSQGIEVNFKHAFDAAWSARLIAAYARHEYASEQLIGDTSIIGNAVDTAPKFTGSLFISWQPTARAMMELEVQHLGEYFLDPENAHSYPGHTLINWRSNYQLNDHWAASLRLLNVDNKLYAERADFTSFTQERYFPGEPRSLFAEIQWKF